MFSSTNNHNNNNNNGNNTKTNKNETRKELLNQNAQSKGRPLDSSRYQCRACFVCVSSSFSLFSFTELTARDVLRIGFARFPRTVVVNNSGEKQKVTHQTPESIDTSVNNIPV